MPLLIVLADAVLDWNGYAAIAIVGVANMPPERGLIRPAMVHVAIYDAVNAIEGYPFTSIYARILGLVRKVLSAGSTYDCGNENRAGELHPSLV